MRISDWSSDVCSSDLLPLHEHRAVGIDLRHGDADLAREHVLLPGGALAVEAALAAEGRVRFAEQRQRPRGRRDEPELALRIELRGRDRKSTRLNSSH